MFYKTTFYFLVLFIVICGFWQLYTATTASTASSPGLYVGPHITSILKLLS